eukprot:gene11238-15079_t
MNLILYIIALCYFSFCGRAFCYAHQHISMQSTASVGKSLGLAQSDVIVELQENNFNIKSKALIKLPKMKGIIDRLTFGWVKKLMDVGNKTPLELSDLWILPENDNAKSSSEVFNSYFAKEKVGKYISDDVTSKKSNVLIEFWKSPVTRAIVKMYKDPFIVTGLLKFLNTMVQFFPSILVSKILKQNSISNAITLGGITIKEGYILSFLLFTTLCSKTAIENQYFDTIINLGAKIRSTLSAAIYRKSLKLSSSSRRNNTMGEIVNYMQVDAGKMEQVASLIHVYWDGLLQVLGYTSLLLYFLGPSVFAGIATILIIIPFNAYFLNRLSEQRAINLKLSDKRVKLTNEILQGIRAIKSYNWEKAFNEKLQNIRQDELKALRESANTRSILVSALSAAPSLVAVSSLATYALLGNKLDATKVFTSLALFNQLRFPLIFLPMLLNTLAEGKVSLKRLTKFLLAEEIENYVDRQFENNNSDNAIKINDGSFSWNEVPKTLKNDSIIIPNDVLEARGNLLNCNIEIKKGELIAIVGPIASGKSTLLNAILGELNKINGNVSVNGKIAYVSQTSWIPNENVRNNILFGNLFNNNTYQTVIKACGLARDFELLEAGDMTEIGEKGVNLSGGQKQRIAIARAVYENADIYLLDDPLSALDVEVGAKVFKNCVKDLLKNKTRLLVTHQLGLLPAVDKIILMDSDPITGSCRIVDQGKLFELLERGHDLSKLVKTNTVENVDIKSLLNENEIIDQLPIINDNNPMRNSDPSDRIQIMTEKTTCDDTNSLLNQFEYPVNDTIIDTNIYLSSMPSTGALVDCCGTDCTGITEESFEPEEGCYVDSLSVESDKSNSNIDPRDTSDSPDSSDSSDVSNNNSHIQVKSVIEYDQSDVQQPKTGFIQSKLTKFKSLFYKIKTDPYNNVNNNKKNNNNKIKTIGGKNLMTKEERGEGAVGWGVYQAYLKSANNPLMLLVVVSCFIFGNASQILQQWIVAAWTSDAGYVKRKLSVYLSGVALMACLVAYFNYARSYLGVILGASASQSIHKKMTNSILKAPLSYFESTPVGRLVQRFSRDLDQIDQQLPGSFGQVIASTLNIIGSMIAITIVTPSFAFVMIAISSVYLKITNYYRTVARELKRLDSISRSPIISHFGESLGGLSIIRSFNRQEMFEQMNEVKLDDNLSAYNAMKAIDRWLSVRLELLGNTIVLFASVLVVLTSSNAGSAGLSLNNALGVTSLLNWAVRNAAETESLMNSVDRVLFTINDTPQERNISLSFANVNANQKDNSEVFVSGDHMSPTLPTPVPAGSEIMDDLSNKKELNYSTDQDLLSSGWPWQGGIVFRDVQMRYRNDFEPVLKGVNLSIQPGESLGIVGRTGSGKSSLFRGLLRLSEIENGSISIDGIDSSSIGLDTIRSSISIIPQDPVLFSGTI